MHYPRIRGLAALAGVRLRAKETEISAASWAFQARKRILLYAVTVLSFVVRIDDYTASMTAIYCIVDIDCCAANLLVDVVCLM